MQDDLDPQQLLDLQTAGVLRYVWDSRFGQIVIEVRDGLPYVNGTPVHPGEARSSCADSSSTFTRSSQP